MLVARGGVFGSAAIFGVATLQDIAACPRYCRALIDDASFSRARAGRATPCRSSRSALGEMYDALKRR